MGLDKKKIREELKELFLSDGGNEQIFDKWWSSWGNSIITLIEEEGLDISVEEGIALIGKILSTFQGLDKGAQGWLTRILVIVYDYFTYKYDPDPSIDDAEIVSLLARRTNTRETDITETIQTLKALSLVPDDILPDMLTGEKYN